MRGLARLFLVIILLVLVAVLLGWLKFRTNETPDNNVNVEMTVDKQQAQKDLQNVKKQAEEASDRIRSRIDSRKTSDEKK